MRSKVCSPSKASSVEQPHVRSVDKTERRSVGRGCTQLNLPCQRGINNVAACSCCLCICICLVLCALPLCIRVAMCAQGYGERGQGTGNAYRCLLFNFYCFWRTTKRTPRHGTRTPTTRCSYAIFVCSCNGSPQSQPAPGLHTHTHSKAENTHTRTHRHNWRAVWLFTLRVFFLHS